MKLTAPKLRSLPRVMKLPPGRKRMTICLFFGFLLLGLPAFAGNFFQSREIKGKVTDENMAPLAGVSVNLKGSETGTTTNDLGEYSISVPSGRGILVFSYIGMKPIEITLGDNSRVDVVMVAEALSLEEVVAIGYGVARKKDLTGSVTTVDGEEVARRNQTQLSQALQGTMPGMMITRDNSEPGAGANIRIRGVTTIGNSNPLIIVDGVPIDNIDDVNPDDIEDISVLNDAASASIYGARAASGVILITTKRPAAGQMSFEYNGSYGFEKPTAFPEVVGVQRYLEMINEFTWNDAGNTPGGEYALYTQDEVENWLQYNQSNPNAYPVTNWVDLLLNDNAPRQSHYFGFRVGAEKVRTQASINYEEIKALYDYKSYKRVMSRVNNTFDFSEYLSANVDFAFNHSISNGPVVNPVWGALRYAPIYAATWADGRIAQGQNGSNVYAELHQGGFNEVYRTKFTGRVALQFKPTRNFVFSAVVSPHFSTAKAKEFTKAIPYYDASDPTLFSGYIAGHQSTNLEEGRSDGRTFTKQFIANYLGEWNNHNFNVMAGYEDYYSFDESLGARALNYVLPNFPYLDLGPLDFMNNSGSAWETAYQSFFGRIMYDYDSRYFLQANIRYDGSSRFHKDHRWGAFPSVSAGWVISEEAFMENDRIFSHLKLRASWGQLGNERIGNYPYQSSIGYSNALFYQGNDVVSTITAAQFAYAIQDITWEVTETANIGVDAYFLKNRLSLTANYFKKKTSDMLLELEIPDYMGFENPQQNTGIMNTTGWDLQLGWRDRAGQIKYNLMAHISDSRSVMGNLGGIVLDGAQIVRQGSEYNEWYGYVSDGIFQTQEEVSNSPKLYSSVKPGDIKYVDISGPDGVPDGKITPDYDRVLLGGSLPRYLYGGTANLEYRNFDFSLVFQGVGKQKARLNQYMVKPFHSAWTNAPAIIDGNYWSHYNTEQENLNARYPRLSYTGAENNNYVMSDHWLISGAYFRLKNIVVGYTLPDAWTLRAKLKGVRLYATVTDLFSIDNYPNGWDPESVYSSYISKSFNFGVSVKF